MRIVWEKSIINLNLQKAFAKFAFILNTKYFFKLHPFWSHWLHEIQQYKFTNPFYKLIDTHILLVPEFRSHARCYFDKSLTHIRYWRFLSDIAQRAFELLPFGHYTFSSLCDIFETWNQDLEEKISHEEFSYFHFSILKSAPDIRRSVAFYTNSIFCKCGHL